MKKYPVYNTLYKWQKPFVDDIIEQDRHGLFLDMGIGKTLISIALGERHDSDLIIVTTILNKVKERYDSDSFGYWLKKSGYECIFITDLETKKGLNHLDKVIKSGKKAALILNYEAWVPRKSRTQEKDENGELMFTVVNGRVKAVMKTSDSEKRVALLRWIIEQYENITMIFDESHFLKTRNSGVSREMQRLLNTKMMAKYNKRIKHVYLLTGTPMTLGYEDLYMQLRLLGLNMTWDDFSDEFIVFDQDSVFGSKWDKPIKGYKNVTKLNELISNYATFAKTEDYFKHLPDKITTLVKVPKGFEYQKMSDPASPDHRVFAGYIADTPAIYRLRLRQLASGYMGNADDATYFNLHKYSKLLEILENNPGNYIVFYTYEPEMHIIQLAAESAGYVYDTYNGWTQEMHWYNNDTRHTRKLVIANIDSGSTGLNRQKYNSVIFFSLPDTYAQLDQAMHRIYRLGQKAKTVFYYLLMTPGTVETDIWRTLRQRRDYTQDMFDWQIQNSEFSRNEEEDWEELMELGTEFVPLEDALGEFQEGLDETDNED